jgi:predicted ATPase
MHFERGRDAQRAVAYLHQAADNARRRSAEREAITHLTKGLALLQTLPQTPERTQQELVLQSTLGASLATVQGYAAPEVERAYARAHALCQHVGTTPQLFPVLWGLLQFSLVRAQLQTARQLGEQLLTLAQSAQDPMLLLAASNGLGTTLTHLGDFLPARAYLEQSIALYEPHMHQASACWYSIDLGVDSRAHLAHVLWLLGYPEQARRRAHEVSTLAQALLHPFSLAHACNLIAVIHQLCGEAALAQARAEAGLALAHEQGMVMELGRGTMLRGWALVAQGQAEEGLDQMRQGLATYRATAAEVWWPYYAALLAEGYGQSGQMVEGLRLLAEALAMTDHSEEHWWNAELQRRKGEFLLVPNASRLTVMEAEHCFQHALRIARCQQAKSLELRAAMSLSRLWQQQGKRDAARALLAPIYGWFTEGFDTADLQEAKALLEG